MSFEYAKSTAVAGLAALGIMSGPGCQAVNNYTQESEQQEERQVQENHGIRNSSEMTYHQNGYRMDIDDAPMLDMMGQLLDGSAELKEAKEDVWVVDGDRGVVAYRVGDNGEIEDSVIRYARDEEFVTENGSLVENGDILDTADRDRDGYIRDEEIEYIQQELVGERLEEIYDQNKR